MPKSLALLLALLALATPAYAEEEYDPPRYSAEDICAEIVHQPPDWAPLATPGTQPASAPTEAKVVGVLKAAGVDEIGIETNVRAFKRDGGKVAFITVLAVDEDPKSWRAAFDTAAKENGWVTKDLGDPSRIAIIWTNAADQVDALVAWQVERSVRRLIQLGIDRRRQAVQEQDEVDLKRSEDLIDAAGRIEPRAGQFHAVKGILIHQPTHEKAWPHFEKALDPKAPVTAEVYYRAYAAQVLGTGLLLKNDKAKLPRAIELLSFAVKHEEASITKRGRYANRYNLACAYARAGETEKALDALEGAFKLGHQLGPEWPQNYEHAKSKDDDMAPLRETERFKAIMTKYAPKTEAGSGG